MRAVGSVRVLAAALVVGALIITSCSGSDDDGAGDEDQAAEEVPVADYVDDLCTGLTSWRDSVQQTEADFQQENVLSGEIAPDEAKAKIGTYLEELKSVNDDFVAHLRAAGIPDVVGGEEVAQQFVNGFDDFSQALSDLQARLEGLSTEPEDTFREKGTEFLTQIQTSLQGSVSNLNQIDSEPIDRAFRESDVCAQFQPAA